MSFISKILFLMCTGCVASVCGSFINPSNGQEKLKERVEIVVPPITRDTAKSEIEKEVEYRLSQVELASKKALQTAKTRKRKIVVIIPADTQHIVVECADIPPDCVPDTAFKKPNFFQRLFKTKTKSK